MRKPEQNHDLNERPSGAQWFLTGQIILKHSKPRYYYNYNYNCKYNNDYYHNQRKTTLTNVTSY